MRSLWPQLGGWVDTQVSFALATMTAVSGSAPRAPGSCMAIAPADLRFIGSVSSGCLDAEIVEAAEATLRTHVPQTLRFGPEGNPPWSDGLSCGGWISVRVEPWWGLHSRAEVREIVPEVRRWFTEDEAGLVITRGDAHVAINSSREIVGIREAFADGILDRAWTHVQEERPSVVVEETDGAANEVFFRAIRRRPRLLIVGGADVAVQLIRLAETMDFSTVVMDPRAAFVKPERFVVPPTRLVRGWPQDIVPQLRLGPRDAAVVLTHDPKIDDPALIALVRSRVGYIGALGSTRSHAARLERLRREGIDELQRIEGPAGIHLGTPDATGIALGIAAGIARWSAASDSPQRVRTTVR